jgi:hypothetical protein
VQGLTETKLISLTLGRSASLTRDACRALEKELKVEADSLWKELLLDERKVDHEVRNYYEERIRASQEAANLTPDEEGLLQAIRRVAVVAPRLVHSLTRLLENARGVVAGHRDPFLFLAVEEELRSRRERGDVKGFEVQPDVDAVFLETMSRRTLVEELLQKTLAELASLTPEDFPRALSDIAQSLLNRRGAR